MKKEMILVSGTKQPATIARAVARKELRGLDWLPETVCVEPTITRTQWKKTARLAAAAATQDEAAAPPLSLSVFFEEEETAMLS